MNRSSAIWLLVVAGFLGLLVNSIWTKHQINEILARQLVSNRQAASSQDGTSAGSRPQIKIRIRGSQLVHPKDTFQRSSTVEGDDSISSQDQLEQDGAYNSFNSQQKGLAALAYGERLRQSAEESSAEADSEVRVPQGFSLRSGEGNSPQSKPASAETLVSAVFQQAQPASALHEDGEGASSSSENAEGEQVLAEEGIGALLGVWSTALAQTRPLAASFEPIHEEPTAAMLEYAATPAQAPPSGMTCETWLLVADQRRYSRNFSEAPITVKTHGPQPYETLAGCGVPCVHTAENSWLVAETLEGPAPAYDAHPGPATGKPDYYGLTYHRHMESVTNFPERAIDNLHASGVDIVMSPQLSSDVPAGYLSWAEYDFMQPPQKKTGDAAAFISKCVAQSFRLEAVKQLSQAVAVHSFGACLNNIEGGAASKGDILPAYHFTLAFENSQEEDYVTEKYAQALVAGSVPVVIGATNMEDFAIAPNSMLVLESTEDILRTGFAMERLLQNASAYEEMLAWKQSGPQDSFLALVDLNAVHSSCRLCIRLADHARTLEEAEMQMPPCKCARKAADPVVHHVMVRERSTFEFRDLFLADGELTVAALHVAMQTAFAGHVPVWAAQRPDYIAQRRLSESGSMRGGELSIYRVYQVGRTQRAALYGGADLDSNEKVRQAVEQNACLRLEVILI